MKPDKAHVAMMQMLHWSGADGVARALFWHLTGPGGRTCGVPTPVNAAIVETVQAITRGCSRPRPELLAQMLERLRRR